MSDEEEDECIVRIPNFSDEKIHTTGTAASTEVGCEEGPFRFRVYANGMNAGEKGHVSVTFTRTMKVREEVSCVVSVTDASGNRRFPTSFRDLEEDSEEEYDCFRTRIMGCVVKRATLLSEPDELLPEDCLTLHFHTIRTERPGLSNYYADSVRPRKSFEFHSSEQEDVRLPLDSSLAKRLIEVSSYFRGLSEGPMLESRRGYATFSRLEFHEFLAVCEILLAKRFILMDSVEWLRQIYVMSDKYDVPPVVESCRGMLSVLSRAAENDPEIQVEVMNEIPQFVELAESLSDFRLMEIVESFLERNQEDKDEDIRTEESATDHVETEWRLERVGEIYFRFLFARGAPEDNFRFYQ